ncbi:MAG TPA: copper resistance protein NlpE [bacterium]|nr:copper resistance protein NlpE [bacterium]
MAEGLEAGSVERFGGAVNALAVPARPDYNPRVDRLRPSFALAAFFFFFAGCSPKDLARDPALLWGVFTGVTPCADCPGIRTELSLYHSGPFVDEGAYELELTYLGRNVKPFVTRGDWTMIKGDAADENASVVQLDPDHPEKSTYYLRIGPDELRQLDRDLGEIDSQLNFTLKKR